MRPMIHRAIVLAGCLTASLPGFAQAPAAGGQKPEQAQQQTTPSQSGANPFPENTSTVPVLPSMTTPPTREGADYGAPSAVTLEPGDDLDPVRSPDDPPPAARDAADNGFSSSLAGMEKLLPPPGDEQPSKKRKLAVKEPTHQEAASKDIEVGTYYLQTSDWKGALSRFESALVLDPENPEVYWGLAEANRRLGNFADARANYEKVAEYDPDSRHGKDAAKALKEPEIANGKNIAASSLPAVETSQ